LLTGLDHQEIDELVDEWVPEPLVARPTALEEAESESLPIIAGCVPTVPPPSLSYRRTRCWCA